uniref:Connexin 27.5 n=1 Tax=Nothobranchius rachovii TaxID=451742 RepID=A0A1A8NSA0_9TELE
MDGSEEGIPAKKSKKSCKYLEKWDSEFTFLKKSRMGQSHAFCKICSCDFSVSHGGRNDVSQHEKSTKHKRWLEAQKHAQTMSAFVTRNTTEADQVINAEVKMAMLCAKNNVSFTFCDDFNKCVAEMFPDSAIARKYSAGKTKSMQLIKEKLSEALRKRGIPWENLIAFNSDNASVMKGRHNSVISGLKTSQPHVQDLGCICHLAQLATGCAIKAAQVPVEDILVGIYTHFDKSAKRCEIYKEFVDFTDSDHLKLLRYCSTRWLSLLTCVQRVLNQWDALQAYFNSHEEVERSAKIHDLASHLRDPVMKIYFMFLTAALKPLSDFNIAFQSEGVQIHRLEEEMCRLIRRILGYLIPARAIVGIPLREVEYGQGHQLADEELFIGADTKAFMKSVELPMSTEKKIFQ